jgi:predicted nucleic acid-binding protein
MFTDAFVMSEFINRYARIRFEAAKMPGQNFKDYRKTAAFVPVAQEITAQARRILTNARPIDQSFSQIDLKLVLSEFETGAFDFNDQLLTETCRQNRLAILTNDADFTEGGFPPPIRHRGIRYMRRSSFL